VRKARCDQARGAGKATLLPEIASFRLVCGAQLCEDQSAGFLIFCAQVLARLVGRALFFRPAPPCESARFERRLRRAIHVLDRPAMTVGQSTQPAAWDAGGSPQTDHRDEPELDRGPHRVIADAQQRRDLRDAEKRAGWYSGRLGRLHVDAGALHPGMVWPPPKRTQVETIV
jgi:hypothetical protein